MLDPRRLELSPLDTFLVPGLLALSDVRIQTDLLAREIIVCLATTGVFLMVGRAGVELEPELNDNLFVTGPDLEPVGVRADRSEGRVSCGGGGICFIFELNRAAGSLCEDTFPAGSSVEEELGSARRFLGCFLRLPRPISCSCSVSYVEPSLWNPLTAIRAS